MLRQALPDPDLRAGDGAGADPLPAAPSRRLIGRLAAAPIYPLLVAVYPIVALFAQNATQIRAQELVTPMAVAVAVAAAAWLALGLLTRDAARSAPIAAVAILVFYSLASASRWTEDLLLYLSRYWVPQDRIPVGPYWMLVPEGLLLAGTVAWVARGARGVAGVNRFLNALAVSTVALSVVQILGAKAPDATRAPRVASPLARLAPPAGARLPDIYYIILDGYARHDVMKSHFDYDNTAFLDHLEQKGFYVARNSTANYCQTPLCLSSSLNAGYLDEMVKGLVDDQTVLRELIGQNDVMATLRPLGYRMVTYATGFEPTEHPELDVYLSPHPYTTEFQRMVIDMTPTRWIWPDPRFMDRFQEARARVSYTLDNLPEVARDPRPTFAFAHVLCPHPPMIFGANGEDVSRSDEAFILYSHKVDGRFEDADKFRRAYRAQATFITRRIQETIDRILAESPEPPIIIVQSDHGSELNLDMSSARYTDMHERMSILNAYYFPGGRYEGLYDSISPVNSFRMMFNTVFGARLPLLPDRSFFSTWPEPYRFVEVTDEVRSRPASGPRIARPGAGRDPHDS